MGRAIIYKSAKLYYLSLYLTLLKFICIFIPQTRKVIGKRFLDLNLKAIFVSSTIQRTTGYAIKRKEINKLRRQEEREREWDRERTRESERLRASELN